MEGKSHRQNSIPVTIVTGFLGSGKTTLLNHILTGEHGIKIGVLVNDFGAINVDADLISEVEDGVMSLANGCICCSIRTDLIQAVLKLVDLPEPPQHIIIEASGVADPAGILKSFHDPEIWKSVVIDGVITVVDAEQALSIPEEERKLANAQVKGGDLILLNKADLVSKEHLQKVKGWLSEVRPGVQIFETIMCQLPMEILLGAFREDSPEGNSEKSLNIHVQELKAEKEEHHHHNDHHHDLMFDTWSYTSFKPIQISLFNEILKNLPSTLFRAKGFIYAADQPEKPILFQLVGKRATLKPTGSWGENPPKTQLVFIGRHETVNFSAIENALMKFEQFKEENTI